MRLRERVRTLVGRRRKPRDINELISVLEKEIKTGDAMNYDRLILQFAFKNLLRRAKQHKRKYGK